MINFADMKRFSYKIAKVLSFIIILVITASCLAHKNNHCGKLQALQNELNELVKG